jgi:hypothetical protein
MLRLDFRKAMMTDPDQHAGGLHPQEQQPLVPDHPTSSAGSSLDTAARVPLPARARRAGLPAENLGQSRASAALVSSAATRAGSDSNQPIRRPWRAPG